MSLADRLLTAACAPGNPCLRVVAGEPECTLRNGRPICAVCQAAAWRRVVQSVNAEQTVKDARAERDQLRLDRDSYIARACEAEQRLRAAVETCPVDSKPPLLPRTRLKRLYGGATPVQPTHGGALTADNVRKLRETIKWSRQDTLITVLAASKQGLADQELWEILGLKKNEALAGITGALKKNSIKAEIGEDFIIRTPAVMNGRIGWRFDLSPRFRRRMEEIGWLAKQLASSERPT